MSFIFTVPILVIEKHFYYPYFTISRGISDYLLERLFDFQSQDHISLRTFFLSMRLQQENSNCISLN